MTLQSTFFETTISGAVAHVAMNRPDKANGMTPDFWADLPRLVREIETDMSVRVLVISGNGKHFTGGMDLASFNDIAKLTTNEAGRAAYAMRGLILKLQDTFNALEQARFPVIAAIHGACVGAGIDMTSACDLRLASEDAFFSIEEINIGMAADVGTLQRLPKLVAPGIVKELAYTGRRFSAKEALAWGFVNSVHADRQAVLDAAFAMAQAIATKSPLAISGIKKAVDYSRDHPVSESLEQIATWNAGMLRPEDMMKAIQSKIAKQEADFTDLMAG
ncbi:MAG: crotonase/enoyl-CoA hydratase family protein [Nitratireductor sp.]